MGLDQALLGGLDTDEVADTLEELGESWYVGLEEEPGWSRAVRSETQHLFSVGLVTSGQRSLYRLAR